jgi:hypothetical protein
MLRAVIFGSLAGFVLLGWGLQTAPAEAQYNRCFDRCMTRCHLPMGYRTCRDDCSIGCRRYPRSYRY